jgi:predicted nucleotidyltransferase
MQPIFTIHAGEYLVGSHLEQNIRDKAGNKINVWIPSKDTGIDLLVTSHDNTKMASIQVKFSKDFLVTHGRPEYQNKLVSCGWWTLNRDKIQKSPADYWIFVLHTFNQKNMQYVIIQPKELKQRLDALHPNVKSLQTYLWVTTDKNCWETRGLKKKDTDLIVTGNYNEKDNATRNFTEHLNNWAPIIEKIT